MHDRSLKHLLAGAAVSAVLATTQPAQAGGCLSYYWCGPGHPTANLSEANMLPPGHPPLPTDRQYWAPRHYGHWHYWGYPRVRGYSANPPFQPYAYGQYPSYPGNGG
jgi:hypothetical protein